jgi:hypothetical protein
MEEKQTLSKKENAALILDFLHRTLMHHAMWFTEVQHKFGKEEGFSILQEAWSKSASIQMKRIAKILGVEMEEGLPKPLMELDNDVLEQLRDGMAVNWLANDGVWFQAVEFTHDMKVAKLCNDSSWAQFSPFEARSIKHLLGLPEKAGLEGLKKALKWRLYAFINEQSFVDETQTGFTFQMNRCRVQDARKRKGLDDYPCKSGGLVEYTTFAETIDPRIQTTCIACPPDPHPETYYCAWRFTLEDPLPDNDVEAGV